MVISLCKDCHGCFVSALCIVHIPCTEQLSFHYAVLDASSCARTLHTDHANIDVWSTEIVSPCQGASHSGVGDLLVNV